MNRWAENCRLRWSTAKVPLVRSGCSPAAYGISPTTLLLHTPTPWASAFQPRLLSPAEDFWTATLLPDGNVSCQPLLLPGIDPAQALRFAGFDPRSRTLSVLLDDPDGTPAPPQLQEKRAACRTGDWEGVTCQEGAVSIRQFRIVDRPDSPPSYLGLQPLEPAAALSQPEAGAIPGRLHFDPTRDSWNHEVFELLTFREPSRQWSDGERRVRVEWSEPGRDMYENTYVVSDEASGEELGRLEARHHPNHSVQAFAGDLLLVPDEKGSGEDAFYWAMRLFNWRTGEQLRRVPLAAAPAYIECEWPRGLLPGSSQTFFTVGWTYVPQPQAPEEGDDPGEMERECTVFFLSPQPGEGGQAPVDDGQVAGGCTSVQWAWTPAGETSQEEAGCAAGGGEIHAAV